MPRSRPPATDARERGLAVLAALAAAMALLVLSWPLAASPPPPLGRALVHVFGAWVAAVLALGALARAVRGRGGGA